MSINHATAVRPSASRARVDAGVPEGGQFAATAHAEPEVSLGSGADTHDLLARYTNPRDLYTMARNAAEYHSVYYGQKRKSNTVDVDDIAQEAILQVLMRVKSGKPITDFKQLVNSVTANVTVRATENKFRAEDRKAYRQWDKKCNDLRLKVGRSLTGREEDALAQEVLDEWADPRHKPSKEFRIARTVDASLDRTFNDGDGVESTLGAMLVSPEASGHYIAPDSYMDKAFTALETKGAAKKAEAKRLAWNAIAELGGVPLAREASLSQRQVTKLRGVMDKHTGGVMQAVSDWSHGYDNDATEALFAPFGELDFEDQEKVASLFERLGADKADDMWANALAFSNNKHAQA